MRSVTFRRLLSIVALLMLLPALLCTETAETWCRVAVGAAVETDDDDGPSFSCRQFSAGHPEQRTGAFVRTASVSENPHNSSIVDEPAFSLPHSIMVPPSVFPHSEAAAVQTLVRAIETYKPFAKSPCFVRPPPRAPPLS